MSARRGLAAAAALALLAGSGAGSAAPAQRVTADPVLTMTEVTHGGRERAMGTGVRAVDVNSRVRIEIDQAALRQAAGGAALPTSVSDDAVAITAILQGTSEAVAALRQAEEAFASSPTAANRAALLAAYQPLGQRALAVTGAAPRGSALRAKLNGALLAAGSSPAAQYAAVFSTAAAHVDSLHREVDRLAAREGVRVRMGAWLATKDGTREVHLPGFDTVQTQAASVVSSFQLFLTPEQSAQFRALAAEAKTMRAQADATPFADVNAVRDRLRSVVAQDLTCVTALPGQLSALGGAARARFTAANDALVQTWNGLKAKYGGGVAFSFDAAAQGAMDAVGAYETVQRWLQQADALVGDAGDAGASALAALEGCRAEVQTKLAAQLGPLASVFQVDAARRLAAESREFSDRVLSLDLGKVPAVTELSLVTAGARSAGDQLAVRMSAVDASGREHVLASRTYLVERAEPHVHLTVAMIWAQREPPLDEAGNERGNDWHPAPGYSILLKRYFGDGGLARRHPGYAELLNPGIGLNLAAPDFDLDDTPEFAVGAVISIFRDYIQGGYSYNFQENEWFPFIGIRLPLPSATLPAVEN